MTRTGSGPLAGQTILVTRPPEICVGLCATLEALGADVQARPSIALAPAMDTGAVDRGLARLDEYDWILFSSANGVRFFEERARIQCVRLSAVRGRVASIGPATTRALSAIGMTPEVVAATSDGPGLAAELRTHLKASDRVLAVRPESSEGPLGPALTELPVQVDTLAVYRNIAAPGAEALAKDVAAGRFSLVILTSPSSLTRLLEANNDRGDDSARVLDQVPTVAIGPTTAAALQAAGITPAGMAQQPTDQGIVEAVLGAIRVVISKASASSAEQEKRLSQNETRETAMHALHVEAGARMVEFAGWHMPVQYSGVLAEHNAVRSHAGLFDVSHMGEAIIQGSQALAFLQHVTCNDVAALTAGRAQYTALTTPEGTFVDDLLIYMLGDDDYLLVLNAGNTAKDLAWLRDHAADFDVSIDDQTEAWSLLALQGPIAKEILQPMVPVDLSKIKYYRFRQTQVAGIDCIVSRTGYTGEHGFEIYAPANQSAAIWQALCTAGEPLGLQRVGLAARDTLRLEAKMALYGNDIDDTTTVLEADLGWIVKLGKGEFVGRDALARQAEEGITRKLVGFEMQGRGIARQGYPVHINGQEVGRVTSGSFAPFLKKNIGLAYLPTAHSDPGTRLEVMIRGRSEAAEVVVTPFYKRSR